MNIIQHLASGFPGNINIFVILLVHSDYKLPRGIILQNKMTLWKFWYSYPEYNLHNIIYTLNNSTLTHTTDIKLSYGDLSRQRPKGNSISAFNG